MTTLNGLPAHILLVHAVVVLLPLSALLLVLTAWWPAGRRRLAGPNAILSVISLGLVPLATDAGEWLQERLIPNLKSPEAALVQTHVDMGESAAAVAIPITVLALLIWWRGREIDAAAGADVRVGQSAAPGAAAAGPSAAPPRPSAAVTTMTRIRAPGRAFLAPKSVAVGMVISVLSIVAAGAAIYDIYRIGDSGAQASWTGKF